jgi:hypothetical protein
MTDIVADFMDRLRKEWPDIPVIAACHINEPHNAMGVSIQRWIQRPEGCEVTVNVSYYPSQDQSMACLLKWLDTFHTLIRTTDPEDVFTQWWGQSVQFLTDPLSLNCTVLLRHSNEVV